MRLSEAVLLLQEEMRRVDAYLEWHADWWTVQGGQRKIEDASLAEGLLAYTTSQAVIRCALRSKFVSIWHTSTNLSTLGVDTDSQILDLREATDYILASSSEIEEVIHQ